jgi:uncharacterized protein (DUF1501 family)
MSIQTVINGNGDTTDALVVVFLRGGADGLSLVAPLEDDGYHRARPRLRVTKEKAVPLDGFFGLHPLLHALEPAWKEGEFTIVHGAGSEDETRSHFEAQDLMEHGGLAAGGWLGRYLRAKETAPAGALSCVAIGPTLPECLLGAPSATAMQSLEEFSLSTGSPKLRQKLEELYAAQDDDLGNAAKATFQALVRIDTMRTTPYTPANGAEYSDDSFSQGMRQVARLIKGNVGLEAASVDLGGWDSHFTQGTLIEPLLTRLGQGLAAFRRDMGTAMTRTTVVVMTEFGRRVQENSAFGTDHGRGGVMWVMGGGVKSRVLGPWPGLSDSVLEGPGDLPVWNNYRDVLAPVLLRHGLAKEGLARVFPDFEHTPLDLYG